MYCAYLYAKENLRDKFKKIKKSGRFFKGLFLTLAILVNFLGVNIPPAHAVASWYSASWGYRTKLTIDHTKVPNTNQSYFPVLINRTDTNWKVTGSGGHVGQADGGDFVFTSSDGTTKLDHEIEKYVSTTGELIAWVEVPTLATATDTEIYLYYGNSGVADQWNINGTWNEGGSANFKGVYHLPDGTTLAALDSTSNGYNGTITSATATTGQVGGGANFDGTGQKVAMSTMPSYTSALTAGGWVKSGGTQETYGGTIIGKRSMCANSTTDFPFNIAFDAGSGGGITAAFDSGNNFSYDATAAATLSNSTTTWHYVVATFTANGTSYLYVDGAQASSASTNFTLASATSPWAIGTSTVGGGCGTGGKLLGKLDEMRVSNVARSADWIATEYNNQSSPSTFYTASSEEAITVPGAPTSLSGTVGNTQVSLSWTAPANDGGLSLTDYVVDYKLASEPTTWSTFADGTSTSTSATVTGLTNSASYNFRVSAVNAVGQGTASSTATTTPATVPTAPTIGTATAGNAEVSVAFTPAAGYTDWYNASWGYRTKITIDHTKVPNTNQSYFPVLINRTDNNWKVVASGGHVGQSDGGDFVITSSDGTTKLDHELEKYTSTTGEVIAWVEVPTLSTSVDTVLYVYYGNAAVADQWNINGTWDEGGSANFKAVWHMPDGSSLSLNDSTSNGKNGSLVDAPAATTGKMDGGISFDGTNDAVDNAVVSTTDTSATYEFWVNFSDITTKIRVPMSWGGSSASLWLWNLGLRSTTDTAPSVGNARMTIRAYDLGAGGSANNRVYGGTNLSANTWYHVAVTGNASAYKIYINGASETLTVGTGSNNGKMVGSLTKAGTAKMAIGTAYYSNAYDFNYGFSGAMDEVRTSSTVRSADWIATEYNNQSSPSTFYSLSPENDYTLPPSTGGAAITGYTATSSPGSITGTGSSSPITVTGLTNGVAYTFTVVATNSVGNSSASSASNSVTPATTPGAPTALSGTAGNAQVALTWSAPASNGGASITDYVVEYKLTSEPTTWSIFSDGTSTTASTTVTGLTNGSAYDFRVSAVNSVGQGTASSTASATPLTVPGAPTIGTATRGNTEAVVTFSAPASNGGSVITGYTVTSSPGSITGTGSASPITVTGLTNGTAYTFTVTATNAAGTGSASSASNSVTPATVPNAPTSASATAGNAQAEVAFSAPSSDGGSSITGYTVTSSPGSITGTGSASPITVTGLSNGTAYTFTVTATNDVGDSSASSASNSVTPVTVPSAPTIGTATAGNAQASVTFTELGASTWYSPSWGYRNKITIDHTKVPNTNQSYFPVLISTTDVDWKVVASGGHVGQSDGGDIVFTSSDGLTKLDHEIEKYTSTTGEVIAWVEVPTLTTATDTDIYMYYGNAGSSDQWNINGTWNSGGSNYFKGVWHLPDGTTLTANDSTVNAQNGTITGPTATAGKVDGSASFSGSNQYVQVAGLIGSLSTVTVSAWVNLTAKDTSGAEVVSIADAVAIRLDTSSPNKISFFYHQSGAWNQILYTQTMAGAGWKYLTYVVSPSTSSQIAYINGVSVGTGSDPDAINYTGVGTNTFIGKHGNGSGAYDFNGIIDEVRISNVTRSADWIATEYNNQSSPSTFYSVAAEIDSASSPSNGGSAVSSYTVTSSPGSLTGTGSSSPITVTGLTNGTAYTFTVTATNAVGTSSSSSASNSVTPATTPDAPTSLTPTAGNAQVALSWTAPSSNGGSALTDYVIEYKLTSEPTTWSIFSDGTSTSTSGTVTSLTNGSSYDFRVSAVNAVGQGSASATATATPVTVPGAPTSASATAGNAQASVAFSAPASNGGSAITSYTVTSSPGNFTGTGSSSPVTVTGLTNGTAYTFTVVATNAVGDGSASSASNSVTPITVPGAPTSVSAAEGNTQATITFTAPVSNGGSAITGYTVTSSPGSFAGTGSSSPITVTGLTNGSTYTFTVTATNAAGTGSSSSASNSVTLSTEPGAPTNLASTVLSSSIGLTWSAPASNGGTAITDYIVEYQLTTGGTWAVFADGTTTSTSATVTGLSNNTSYDFRVRAVNIIGQSVPSSTTTATPGEPAQVLIQSFSDLTTPSIVTAVRITNEGAIAYEYQYTWCVTDASNNLCGGGNDVFSSSAAKLIQASENWDTSLSSTVSTPGTYYFHISVTYGSSSSSAYQSFTSVATYPDAPTIGTATAGNAQASVTFSAPAIDGGATITGYTVTSSPGGLTGTGSSSPITVTGLTNGTAYTFTVTATNSVGTSSSSSASNSVTPATVPGAPTGLTATAGNAQVALSWTAPTSDGGSAITDYVVEYKLSSDLSWIVYSDGTSTTTTATVVGLTNGVSYDFRVSAVNAIGQSSVNSTSNTTLTNTENNNTSPTYGSSPRPQNPVLPAEEKPVIVPETATKEITKKPVKEVTTQDKTIKTPSKTTTITQTYPSKGVGNKASAVPKDDTVTAPVEITDVQNPQVEKDQGSTNTKSESVKNNNIWWLIGGTAFGVGVSGLIFFIIFRRFLKKKTEEIIVNNVGDEIK